MYVEKEGIRKSSTENGLHPYANELGGFPLQLPQLTTVEETAVAYIHPIMKYCRVQKSIRGYPGNILRYPRLCESGDFLAVAPENLLVVALARKLPHDNNNGEEDDDD